MLRPLCSSVLHSWFDILPSLEHFNYNCSQYSSDSGSSSVGGVSRSEIDRRSSNVMACKANISRKAVRRIRSVAPLHHSRIRRTKVMSSLTLRHHPALQDASHLVGDLRLRHFLKRY